MTCVVRSERRAFDGVMGYYEHQSSACRAPMRFGVYLPPAAVVHKQRVPALYCLAGLECNEETFATKAGALRWAAELGLALITPDTSPRSPRLPGDDESWDFGVGAGFYLDATQPPWSDHYQLRTWLEAELPAFVEASFPLLAGERSILGHSMGGHGALTIALRDPTRWKSVSAFAPIAAPSQVPWGQKAFARYLGEDRARWAEYDAVELLRTHRLLGTLLVDQGSDDKFLERELKPDLLAAACKVSGQPLELRIRQGYDHSYWFIASFVEEHLRHHHHALTGR